MPNWCNNRCVVTGPEITVERFKRTCITEENKGLDFQTIIPKPEIVKGTTAGGLVDDALLVLGRADIGHFGGHTLEERKALDDALLMLGRTDLVGDHRLEERMKKVGVATVEEFTAWIHEHQYKEEEDVFEQARRSIRAFEETGFADWYEWSIANWGTKWNASDFQVIKDEPGRYEFDFDTAWSPPEPIYAKLAEMFPGLCFEISGDEPGMGFDYEATGRNGEFSIKYDDINREGTIYSNPDETTDLLKDAKSYGYVPERWLCIGLCRAVIHRSFPAGMESKEYDYEGEVAVWARGDSAEECESRCREIIAEGVRDIKTNIGDWQFTIHSPGQATGQQSDDEEAA